MYFVYRGLIIGGHNVMAVSDLGTTFYFAEGTTRPGFEEWICLLNPGNTAADVNITYIFQDGATLSQQLEVGAHSRCTIFVNDYVPPDTDVSLAIESSQPILVERPLYFNYHGDTMGGNDAVGFNQ